MSSDGSATLPDWLSVSRETVQRLEAFVALVEKWNPAINLVSRRSMSELWDRHLLDSAQLVLLIPSDARLLVDLGSGGGFPGIVLAILGRESLPDLRFTLVEADRRKATFLSEAVRLLELNGTVLPQRIEAVPPLQADVVTARALAPLVSLCDYVQRLLNPTGAALFPKGAQAESEIAEARRVWSFTLTQVPSRSDAQAKILQLRDLRHV